LARHRRGFTEIEEQARRLRKRLGIDALSPDLVDVLNSRTAMAVRLDRLAPLIGQAPPPSQRWGAAGNNIAHDIHVPHEARKALADRPSKGGGHQLPSSVIDFLREAESRCHRITSLRQRTMIEIVVDDRPMSYSKYWQEELDRESLTERGSTELIAEARVKSSEGKCVKNAVALPSSATARVAKSDTCRAMSGCS